MNICISVDFYTMFYVDVLSNSLKIPAKWPPQIKGPNVPAYSTGKNK